MSFPIGAILDFATGVMVTESRPGSSGATHPVMLTEQRIWDGNKWLLRSEAGDLIAKLSREYTTPERQL